MYIVKRVKENTIDMSVKDKNQMKFICKPVERNNGTGGLTIHTKTQCIIRIKSVKVNWITGYDDGGRSTAEKTKSEGPTGWNK